MAMNARIVTVFGGSGFLGRHIVRRLCKDGWRVRVAVRKPHLAQFLRPMGAVGQVQLFHCNVGNPDHARRVLDGADAAINLVGVLKGGLFGGAFERLHAEAPGILGEAAQAAGVSTFVQMSSLGASRDASAHYARSKGDGEYNLRQVFSAATVLRPSIVFGPEDDFFNRFAAMARLSPVLPLIGGGKTRFQPVFAGDVADATALALSRPGETYELGGPAIYTFKELMALILKLTGRTRLLAPVPFPVARAMAMATALLPFAPLTPDQVELLKTDNVVSSGAQGFAALGLQPCGLDAILPSYLWRFRKTGQFETAAP